MEPEGSPPTNFHCLGMSHTGGVLCTEEDLDRVLAELPDEFFEATPPPPDPPRPAAPFKRPLGRVSDLAPPTVESVVKRARPGSEEDEVTKLLRRRVRTDANVSIQLDNEQMEVVECALKGNSLFLTGNAGTGKSVVIREIDRRLSEQGVIVYKIAHNGVAAANVGGLTAHSFAGLGIDDKPPYRIPASKEPLGRLRDVDVLIIDEISTLPCAMLDGFNLLFQKVRKNNLPFGGVRVIACGDFHQLKPINDNKKTKDVKEATARSGGKVVKPWIIAYNALPDHEKALLHPPSYTSTYSFNAKCWRHISGEHYERAFVLSRTYRQQTDERFLNLLNEVRIGRLSETSRQLISKRLIHDVNMLPVDYTMLFATRAKVKALNDVRLSNLPDPGHTFVAGDTCLPDYRKLLEHSQLLPEIHLKVGCRVMLKRNLSRTLVNGSCGQLIGFSATLFEDQRKRDGLYRPVEGLVFGRSLSPQEVQSALHGKPIPGVPMVNLELSSPTVIKRTAFEAALESLKKEQDKGTTDSDDLQGAEFRTFRNGGFAPLPVVLFDNGEYLVVTPGENKLEIRRKRPPTPQEIAERDAQHTLLEAHAKAAGTMPPKRGKRDAHVEETITLFSRIQFPLIPAYAISIHQSQGLTIRKLCVGIGSEVFEDGMAYVALSRGESLDTLVVSSFSMQSIRADGRVLQFYSDMQSIKENHERILSLRDKKEEDMTADELLDLAMSRA